MILDQNVNYGIYSRIVLDTVLSLVKHVLSPGEKDPQVDLTEEELAALDPQNTTNNNTKQGNTETADTQPCPPDAKSVLQKSKLTSSCNFTHVIIYLVIFKFSCSDGYLVAVIEHYSSSIHYRLKYASYEKKI